MNTPVATTLLLAAVAVWSGFLVVSSLRSGRTYLMRSLAADRIANPALYWAGIGFWIAVTVGAAVVAVLTFRHAS